MIVGKIMEIICYTLPMFVSAASLIVLRMYNLNFFFIYYYIPFLPVRVATNQQSVFMLPVGLCE